MRTEKLNAAAGVGSRNGAGKVISGGKIKREDRAQPRALASHLVALIDRDGSVTGIFAGRLAARAHLQGGWA